MRTRSITAVAVAGMLGIGLAACGDDGNDADQTPAETTAEATADDSEMTDEMTDEMTGEPGTIVDVAVDAGDFQTLVAAVTAAGLVETLSGDDEYTVFAPTDDAFAAAITALGITAEELLADTETLTSILTYHVVSGEVLAADVVGLDGQSVETVNGATVDITIDGDTVMVNDATVITADVDASNGVIHVIDTVLLPPAS
jgi:transforming growth factor-beta-induced protein